MAVYIYFFLFMFFLFLFILTGNEDTKERCVEHEALRPFVRIGSFLMKRMDGVFPGKGQANIKRAVSEDLKILYPDAAGRRDQDYVLKKISYVLLVLFVGNLCCLFLSIGSRMGNGKMTMEKLLRNDYGGGKKEVTLLAAVETETQAWEESVTISLGEREYTEEEAYAWIDQAEALLPEVILSENEDFDHITKDLELVRSIDDIPVSIEWESGDYRLIDASGHLTASELPEEGAVCMLTARISCQNFRKESIFYVKLCQPELTYAQQLQRDLQEAVREAESRDRTEQEVLLPQEIGNESITWIYQKKDNSVTLLILILILAGGIFFAMDRDLHQKVLKRQEEMARDYPELISKLVLFMGAGMTVRGAFHRIAADYEKNKKADRSAYAQIVRACHEMDSGVSEEQAYLNLGKYCSDQHYVRLSMLLSQNLRKGNAGLTQLLEKEAAEAFEERKRNARKFGEEAGTKLLFPMMLMLLIVMVIIMVPAFLSFGS